MSPAHPPLRPFGRGVVPAPTAAESVELDRRAIEDQGVPQSVLMENAGRSAAAVLGRLFAPGPVVGVVGSGNNGGDALVLLRTLRAWGREVHAVLAADRPPGEDPLLHGWSLPITRDAELDGDGWSRLLGSAAVVVDGVLGTGVRGEPRERQAATIRHVNGSGRPVLALDVPSGIDATTGAVPGEAVAADVTVAFGAPKLGSLLHPARARVGRLVAVEIAFPPWQNGEAGALIATPAWVRARLPRRGSDTHKKAVGCVLVIAGQPGMGGAAILTAKAAFRAGAGLVRVCSAPENRAAVQSALPEAIYVDGSDAGALEAALAESDAVAAGPGLGTGEAAERFLAAVAGGPRVPAVLDADALNAAAAGALDLAALGDGRPLLITPHPGEMSRLLEPGAGSRASEPGDPAARARAAAERFACAVLLKGAPSVVAAPGAPLLVDTQSSSDLAVAGMGDALTGVCAALLAQGLGPRESGAAGLYLSGRAARLAGRGAGLVPSDVIRWLPEAMAEEADPVSDLDLPFVVFDADAAR
ncbi:MAG TPA: NAD(P)H-hydrate dehydratase [Longimicrobiales bacterium]|nr:NAD(P)H-hydrate dehydratase [Longimicrobiales bacterium]